MDRTSKDESVVDALRTEMAGTESGKLVDTDRQILG